MKIIASCGVICDICLGFQREKNQCVGCSSTGFKPLHCEKCQIKRCPEKNGNNRELCVECEKFPCKRIKNLDKRYRTNYNESPIENLQLLSEKGLKHFIETEKEKWTCPQCGMLLCVHRDRCLHCDAENRYFIIHAKM
jgi:hypothetical protein